MPGELKLWVNDTSTLLGSLHTIRNVGFTGVICCLVKHNHVPMAYPYQAGCLKQIIADAATVDLTVDTWSYGYPAGIPGQIAAIAGALPPGAKIHVLDWEGEWENNAAAAVLAEQFAHGLAEATDHRVQLSLSSFYAPDLHPSFPWTAALQHCEEFWPQVYVIPPTPVGTVISRAITQCPPLAAGTIGGKLTATVSSPDALMAVAVNASYFNGGVNVWVWDGGGVDMGVRGRETEWAPAISFAHKAFA